MRWSKIVTGTVAVLSLTVLAGTTGCVERDRVVVREDARPRKPCRGGEWISGHRGPRGGWHEGHWRCPGVVEVVEVD